MATPLGHALAGMLVARRLGVRSPAGLTLAAAGACAPDLDLLVGAIFARNPWKWHRKLTHTPGFLTSLGAAAGLAGLVSGGRADGERDLVADGLTGAAVVGTHLLLDVTPVPMYIRTRQPASPWRMLRNESVNLAIDAIVYGGLLMTWWPRDRAPAATGEDGA